MKIILHIGPPKTGTTAIQGALMQNRRALLEAGALYFVDPVETAWALPMIYHREDEMLPALRAHFWSIKEAQAWSTRAWTALENQINRLKPHTLILSSEHFASMQLRVPAMLEHLRTFSNDIDVVAYVRDPASLYCSYVDQQLRGGTRLNNLPSPWDYKYPPVGRVKRYLDAVGPDRMHVQAFDRKHLHGGDIVADFVHVLNGKLGLGLPQLQVGGSPNTALSGAAAAMLAVMNETYVRHRKDGKDQDLVKHRSAFIKRLRQSQTLGGLPRLALPNDALKSVIRHNARTQLGWFNDTFFGGRPVMDVGAAPAAPAPKKPEQGAFMRDWILGYLDGEASRLAAQEIVTAVTPQSAPAPAGQRKGQAAGQKAGQKPGQKKGPKADPRTGG